MVDGISGQVLGYQALPLAAVTVAVGLLGALALWSRPRVAWAWALGALGLACAVLAGSWVETGWTSTADLLSALVAGVGVVALLAQHPTPTGHPAVLLTLLGTFMGFGALWPEPAMRVWALGAVGPVLIAALIRFGAPRDGGWWIGVGLFGVGLAVLALRPFVESEAATLLGLIVVALFLPVFPLHGAFIVTVTRLPGTATAVFAVLLPVLGFSELLALAPTLPNPWRSALLGVAALTAVFGSLKALVQLRMEGVVAYSQFVQMALLLWYVVAAYGREPVLTETALYLLVAVLLIWSGLHLAASQVRARFGS
ncbi:MAG: proton-conducting transporter membrane subunit, partial [Nitrospirales bacterium]